jgi:hypothetical protein
MFPDSKDYKDYRTTNEITRNYPSITIELINYKAFSEQESRFWRFFDSGIHRNNTYSSSSVASMHTWGKQTINIFSDRPKSLILSLLSFVNASSV